jgi:hypothetical protein
MQIRLEIACDSHRDALSLAHTLRHMSNKVMFFPTDGKILCVALTLDEADALLEKVREAQS